LSDKSRHRSPAGLLFAALCLTTWTSLAWALDPETLASHEDAYVKHDAAARAWL